LKTIRIASLLVIICATIPALAQPAGRAIVNQPIEWFSTTANIKLHKKVTLLLDGQYRFVGSFEPMQFQARVGVDVKINDHLSVIPLGYVYTINPIYGEQPAGYVNNEHRFWHQVFYKHTVSKFKIDHRFRFEERFIQKHTKNGTEVVDLGYTDKRIRFRYRFMARVPLNKPTIEAKAIFVGVYDEVFLSRGKEVKIKQPDQNRIFAGLGYQVNKDLNILGGFLYQLNIKATGLKQENNVGVQVMLGYNLDLTKPTK
jgi:hypothetical protein